MIWRMKFEDYIKLTENTKDNFDAYQFMSDLSNFKVRYIDPDKFADEIYSSKLHYNIRDEIAKHENSPLHAINMLKTNKQLRKFALEEFSKGMEGEGILEFHFQDSSAWHRDVPSALLVRGPKSFHQWIESNIDLIHVLPIFTNNFSIDNIERGYWGGNENSFYWINDSKRTVYKLTSKYDSNFGNEIYKFIESQKSKKLPDTKEDLTFFNALNIVMVFDASPELQLKMVEQNPEYVNNIENPTVEAQEKAIQLGGKEMLNKLYWPLPEIKEKYKYFFSMKRSGMLK